MWGFFLIKGKFIFICKMFCKNGYLQDNSCHILWELRKIRVIWVKTERIMYSIVEVNIMQYYLHISTFAQGFHKELELNDSLNFIYVGNFILAHKKHQYQANCWSLTITAAINCRNLWVSLQSCGYLFPPSLCTEGTSGNWRNRTDMKSSLIVY